MMTVEQARQAKCCRICGVPIATVAATPAGWTHDYRERIYPPPAVFLDFGQEFAHTDCLKAECDRQLAEIGERFLEEMENDRA